MDYKDIKEVLKTIVILVDTREQKNKHITDYLDSKGVAYVNTKLEVGDYSCRIPGNDLIRLKEISFADKIAIERKNSLDELSQNFTKHRERFEKEFLRKGKAKVILAIENNSINDMLEHKYRSQLTSQAFIASLLTYEHRYNVQVTFIDKKHMGLYIYMHMYYFVKEYLKGL